jgi:hypothetical protein
MRLGRKAIPLFAMLLASASASQAADSPYAPKPGWGLQLRSLYFDRDLPGTAEQETWATSAQLWGRTGYLADVVSLGGAIFADVPFYAPDNRDGGLMLKPGQKGFAVVGEAYARFKYQAQTLTLYRQTLGINPQTAEGVRSLQTDLNYLGSRDIRMLPLTYEAAMFAGKITDTLRYQAGYVDSVKDINSDKFVAMSRLAGANADNGMWTGGVQWNPAKDLWVQGFYYSVKDTIRIAYTDVDWVNRIDKARYWRVASQYSDQRSDGANLIGNFSTWNFGVYGEYGHDWLKVYAAAATTGEGAAIRTPWSYGPFYISQRIKTFSRAGEDAWMAGTTFDFSKFGLAGFSVDFNYADGRHAIDAVTRAGLPTWKEFDTDFIYRFAKESPLSGARIRLRWGTVREEFGTRTDRTDDTRLDFNWAINFN